MSSNDQTRIERDELEKTPAHLRRFTDSNYLAAKPSAWRLVRYARETKAASKEQSFQWNSGTKAYHDCRAAFCRRLREKGKGHLNATVLPGIAVILTNVPIAEIIDQIVRYFPGVVCADAFRIVPQHIGWGLAGEVQFRPSCRPEDSPNEQLVMKNGYPGGGCDRENSFGE